MRKLKLISMLLVVIMVVSMLPLGMISVFAETEAEANADLKIGTADDWLSFVDSWYTNKDNFAGKTVVLTNNIDLSETPGNPNPSDEGNADGSGSFAGTLDGQGYTVSGYSIPVIAHDYGMLGFTPSGTTTIKNITFDGVIGTDYYTAPKQVSSEGKWRVGILYAQVQGGTLNVQNVQFKGIVFGRAVGAVASEVSSKATVNIQNCEMSASVLNCWNGGAGGFIANNGGTVNISNTVMSGSVFYVNSTVDTQNPSDIGGFVGTSSGTLKIWNSIMAGSVRTNLAKENASNKTFQYMGGFLGACDNTSCSLTIEDSVMLGNIESVYDDTTKYQTCAGGLVGFAKGASVTIDDCALYGAMITEHDQNGHLFGNSSTPGASLTVTNVIIAGTVYERGYNTDGSKKPTYGASGRISFGANNSTSSNYNIYMGSTTYGASYKFMGGSNYIYGNKDINNVSTPVAKPYDLKNRTNLLNDKFDEAIRALTVNADTYPTQATAFVAEKETAISTYRADWTFSNTMYPIPTACKSLLDSCIARVMNVDHEGDLLMFAMLVQSGYTFAGQTIKMNADIVLNDGWNAFAETVTAPSVVWPLTANDRKFAGTFDGQGHTISGIYLKGTGEGIGIFGNVATGTVGTVKNVKIVNSYVEGNDQGVGGIFGEVDNETTSQVITEAIRSTYGKNKTKAVIDNVYLNINVVNTASANGDLGTGGFIGGSRSDVLITNSAFIGNVNGGIRGTAAFVGSVRPYQKSNINHYINNITVKNCYASGELNDTVPSTTDSFVGALVGYSNANTSIHTFENIITNCSVSGKNYLGYLVGGTHTTPNSNRDSTVTDAQIWNFTNVSYVTPEGGTLKAVGESNLVKAENVIKLNGTTLEGKAERNDEMTAAMCKAAADLPKVLYTFASDMSVTLKDSLALNVYVDEADMILNAANTGAVAITVNGDAVEGVKDGATYKFTYTGILPQQIVDDVKVDLGVISKTTTIKAYLATLLDDEAAQDVAADLLRYAAAAQVYCNYKADTLATAGLDLDGLGTAFVAPDASAPVAGDTVKSVALRLDNTLALVGNDGTIVPVFAKEMDAVKTVGDATCSVAAYVEWAVNGGVTDENALNLVKAIYSYGMSAAAYNG